ncbi:MAG: hypothetical protein EA424_11490 [Planctomycetaceae bacterium]|nr:MAG: hypothetical protein EA424_11490 [Planctomycetaceae bacterium]
MDFRGGMMQMDRPAWKTRRATLMVFWALIVLGMVGWATPGFADNCGCGSGCVDMANCPAPYPVLETLGGHSLFWHDPCGGGYFDRDRDCLFHNSTPPLWYASAEFLPLLRDQRGSQPFQAIASRNVEVIRDSDGAVVDEIVTYPREAVLGTNDFNNNFEPGFRVTLGRALGDWYRIEGSYFGTHNWSDRAQVRYREPIEGGVDGNMLSPLSNFGNPGGLPGLFTLTEDEWNPQPGLDFNMNADIRFQSRLDSAELNLRRRVRTAVDRQVRAETSCLIGLRYMGIDELFEYKDTNHDVSVKTGNNMFGIQIGALSQFLVVDRGWIDFEIKGVMFFNDASNRIESSVQSFPALTTAQADRTAFMGDLSLMFNYQVAPAWTFRLGYNAMWLSGVALASENFLVDVNSLVSGPGALDASGRVVYHGPTIGMVLAR